MEIIGVSVVRGDSSVVEFFGEQYSWDTDGDLLAVFNDEAEEMVAQFNGWLSVRFIYKVAA